MMTTDDFEKYDGDARIDTRDLRDLQEEAQSERDELEEAYDDAQREVDDWGDSDIPVPLALVFAAQDRKAELALWDEENGERFAKLNSVCADLPSDEESMIRDDEFEGAMDELVGDCYSLPKDLPDFVTLTINYEMLKQDYAEVTWGGSNYYVRNC